MPLSCLPSSTCARSVRQRTASEGVEVVRWCFWKGIASTASVASIDCSTARLYKTKITNQQPYSVSSSHAQHRSAIRSKSKCSSPAQCSIASLVCVVKSCRKNIICLKKRFGGKQRWLAKEERRFVCADASIVYFSLPCKVRFVHSLRCVNGLSLSLVLRLAARQTP